MGITLKFRGYFDQNFFNKFIYFNIPCSGYFLTDTDIYRNLWKVSPLKSSGFEKKANKKWLK